MSREKAAIATAHGATRIPEGLLDLCGIPAMIGVSSVALFRDNISFFSDRWQRKSKDSGGAFFILSWISRSYYGNTITSPGSKQDIGGEGLPDVIPPEAERDG